MNKAVSSLLLKSNRLLGAQLVDCGLISLQQLDNANASLLDRFTAGDIREASLLKVLICEHKVLAEKELLNYQIEHRHVSGIVLDHYQVEESAWMDLDLDEAWATWTLPVDHASGVWFLASAYIMSPFVRRYWSDRLKGEIVWYACQMEPLELAISTAADAQTEHLNARQVAAV